MAQRTELGFELHELSNGVCYVAIAQIAMGESLPQGERRFPGSERTSCHSGRELCPGRGSGKPVGLRIPTALHLTAARGEGPRQRHGAAECQWIFLHSTLQKIERKHAAHAAVLSSPNDATRADYREANNAARRAVKKDQERYFKQQALFAEHALKAGNLAVFHKHVQRIFKEQQGSSSAAPTAVLGGADGKQGGGGEVLC